MRRTVATLLVVLGLAGVSPAVQAQSRSMLSFRTMFGVEGPFLGETNAIRGVVGDELPWEIAVAVGTLDTSGHLRIKVRGLVFKDDPLVPPKRRGKNDETEFRAIVSCLTVDGAGGVAPANMTTAGFPANVQGDSDIDTIVLLPSPCVAPIVFVIAGSEDKWFSATGFETEAE